MLGGSGCSDLLPLQNKRWWLEAQGLELKEIRIRSPGDNVTNHVIDVCMGNCDTRSAREVNIDFVLSPIAYLLGKVSFESFNSSTLQKSSHPHLTYMQGRMDMN